MIRTKKGICSLVAASVLALGSASAQADTFKFSFDNSPDGTVTPPLVGSGTFSFSGSLAAGDYQLISLANFTFDFTVSGLSFGNADVVTPLPNIFVRITDSGTDQLINFGGSGGGPFGGSLDFIKGPDNLSFQPVFGSLYFSNGNYGTYVGINSGAVPEPASWAMMIGGLGFAGALMRRRRVAVSFA